MGTRVRAAGPLKEFAAALRLLRKRAGHPTLRTMERRTDYSAATFCRAESGTRVPSLGATLAYVRACGGDEELWRAQHAQLLAARRENRRVVFYPWRGFAPGRDEATNEMTAAVEAYLLDRSGVESLAKAMQRMRAESGLTLAQIAKRTACPEITEQIGGKPLPVSTIGDLCNPSHRRVPSRRTLRGFLLAIEAPETALILWEDARQILAAGPNAAARAYDIGEFKRQLITSWSKHDPLRSTHYLVGEKDSHTSNLRLWSALASEQWSSTSDIDRFSRTLRSNTADDLVPWLAAHMNR